jgi:uncharacterized protein YbjT (DUF2867 family)
MSIQTVTVIGATGLIGGHLVARLQKEGAVEAIQVLVRRPVQFKESKVRARLVDFSDTESFKLAIEGSDAVFCAVGTTQKKVKGDRAAYRKVDYDIPVNAARFCAETGCQKFLLVSSVGADGRSNNFYLKLKGEVEEAVQKLSIRSISIFRPSVLLGHRLESRPAERIGQVLMQAFSFFLVGSLRKYKPVRGADVAAAMVNAAKKNVEGKFVYEHEEIKALL